MAKLTVKKVEALIKAGGGKTQRHADGEGWRGLIDSTTPVKT